MYQSCQNSFYCNTGHTLSMSMHLRLAICLLTAIALAIMPSGTYAQSSHATTSLVALNYYTNAAVDSMTTVSFDVLYSTNQNVWLITAIGCEPSESKCSSVSIDGVDSSPFPCNSTVPLADQTPLISGTCYLTVSTSGVDFFSYNLSFGRAGTYHLTASSQLDYPGNSTNIPGSQSVSSTMTITVTGP